MCRRGATRGHLVALFGVMLTTFQNAASARAFNSRGIDNSHYTLCRASCSSDWEPLCATFTGQDIEMRGFVNECDAACFTAAFQPAFNNMIVSPLIEQPQENKALDLQLTTSACQEAWMHAVYCSWRRISEYPSPISAQKTADWLQDFINSPVPPPLEHSSLELDALALLDRCLLPCSKSILNMPTTSNFSKNLKATVSSAEGSPVTSNGGAATTDIAVIEFVSQNTVIPELLETESGAYESKDAVEEYLEVLKEESVPSPKPTTATTSPEPEPEADPAPSPKPQPKSPKPSDSESSRSPSLVPDQESENEENGKDKGNDDDDTGNKEEISIVVEGKDKEPEEEDSSSGQDDDIPGNSNPPVEEEINVEEDTTTNDDDNKKNNTNNEEVAATAAPSPPLGPLNAAAFGYSPTKEYSPVKIKPAFSNEVIQSLIDSAKVNAALEPGDALAPAEGFPPTKVLVSEENADNSTGAALSAEETQAAAVAAAEQEATRTSGAAPMQAGRLVAFLSSVFAMLFTLVV